MADEPSVCAGPYLSVTAVAQQLDRLDDGEHVKCDYVRELLEDDPNMTPAELCALVLDKLAWGTTTDLLGGISFPSVGRASAILDHLATCNTEDLACVLTLACFCALVACIASA